MSARVLKRNSDEFCSDAKRCKKNDDLPSELPPPPVCVDQKHRCASSFYSQPCTELARSLLGCLLVRATPTGTRASGLIVETEAYLGGPDRAAHSYDGKRTVRNEAMYMPPGTCYVYAIYGMHHCVNISSLGAGSAVLIRALEPREGLDGMRRRRKAAKNDLGLCSGPGKLCQALGIDKSCDKADLLSCDHLWMEPRSHDLSADDIVAAKRVGIDHAGPEWAAKLLRFYIHNNKYISKK